MDSECHSEMNGNIWRWTECKKLYKYNEPEPECWSVEHTEHEHERGHGNCYYYVPLNLKIEILMPCTFTPFPSFESIVGVIKSSPSSHIWPSKMRVQSNFCKLWFTLIWISYVVRRSVCTQVGPATMKNWFLEAAGGGPKSLKQMCTHCPRTIESNMFVSFSLLY